MNIKSLWKLLNANRGAKMKDSILISLLAGLIATTAMEISTLFLFRRRHYQQDTETGQRK